MSFEKSHHPPGGCVAGEGLCYLKQRFSNGFLRGEGGLCRRATEDKDISLPIDSGGIQAWINGWWN